MMDIEHSKPLPKIKRKLSLMVIVLIAAIVLLVTLGVIAAVFMDIIVLRKTEDMIGSEKRTVTTVTNCPLVILYHLQ